jgi:gamma-glutamylcyclotransferase (GGCT)/AIG2-like uncharacterized protein YtfP
MTSSYLFVYGTLKSDAFNPNAQKLHHHAKLFGPARWQGALYRIRNYPGAVRSDNKDEYVLGELWRLNNAKEMLAVLDKYEECAPHSPLPHEYIRILEPVYFGAEIIDAWIYLYNLDTENLEKIESGNFVNENQTLVRRVL